MEENYKYVFHDDELLLSGPVVRTLEHSISSKPSFESLNDLNDLTVLNVYDKSADSPNDRLEECRVGNDLEEHLLTKHRYHRTSMKYYTKNHHSLLKSIKKRQKKNKNKTNTKETTLTLVKSFVGSSLVLLPGAFRNAGLLMATFIIFSVYKINAISMTKLIELGNNRRKTYDMIAFDALGFYGSLLINVSICLAQMSFCCVYVLIVASNIQDYFFCKFSCEIQWRLSFLILFFIQFLIYIPLNLINDRKIFSRMMILGDIFIGLGIVILCIKLVYNLMVNGTAYHLEMVNTNWPLTLGFSIGVWEGVSLVLPLKNAMRKHAQFKFGDLLSGVLYYVMIFYILLGIVGYACYGSFTNSVILLNMDNSWSTDVMLIFYTSSIILSVPLQMLPVYDIMDNAVFNRNYLQNVFSIETTNYLLTSAKPCLQKLSRIFLLFLVLLISYSYVEMLDNFVAILGALICTPVAFIYPALFHYILTKRHRKLHSENVQSIDIIERENISENQNKFQFEYNKIISTGLLDLIRKKYREYKSKIKRFNRKYLFSDLILIVLGICFIVITTKCTFENWKYRPIVTRCDTPDNTCRRQPSPLHPILKN